MTATIASEKRGCRGLLTSSVVLVRHLSINFYESFAGAGMTIEPLSLKDILGPIATILAVIIGVWQYRRTALRDFVKPLREAQLAVYQKAAAAAASLATLPRCTNEWKTAKGDFLQLYYGPLTMFEDFDHETNVAKQKVTVERAMIALKHCLDNENWSELAGLSLGLGHTCRNSLGKVWGYDLPQLQGDYGLRVRRYEETFMNSD